MIDKTLNWCRDNMEYIVVVSSSLLAIAVVLLVS